MKTQQQIEKFIETVENLIPKLEEKKLEYMALMQGMGYQTEGYLCYHSLGKVDAVAL